MNDLDVRPSVVVLARRLPCHRHDPNLWFAESPDDLEIAKALCGPCPVRPACLAGALQRREPSGVWGGEIVVGGRVVPRKRPRGRPRKKPVEPTLVSTV